MDLGRPTFNQFMREVQSCVNFGSSGHIDILTSDFDLRHAYDTRCSPVSAARIIIQMAVKERLTNTRNTDTL